jgi:hypothetical protein
VVAEHRQDRHRRKRSDLRVAAGGGSWPMKYDSCADVCSTDSPPTKKPPRLCNARAEPALELLAVSRQR